MYDDVIAVLEPLIGLPMAVMCLRSAAMLIGKPPEELERQDLGQLEKHIRKALSGITTKSMLDIAIGNIREAIG